MAEDHLDDWLISDGLAGERSAHGAQAAAEPVASGDLGDSDAAMTAIAAWLDTMPDLPVVEFAVLSSQTVGITFAEDVVLPAPWASPQDDAQQPYSQWGITHHDAVSLPSGENYGWQTAGLTEVGARVDGDRLLMNTCRWNILQVAGTDEWVRTLMITAVANQVAEPWSAEHDIWLVGFEDTARKIINCFAEDHPPHRFHIAESLGEVSPEDLKDTTATLYVMGASEQSEAQFQALNNPGVGMVTDRIVTDKAMFLSERDEGAAALGPFAQDLDLWPNLSEKLVEKIERDWELSEEAARQKADAADFAELLEENSATAEKTPEQVKADFEAMMAHSNVTAEDFTIGTPGAGKATSDAQPEGDDPSAEQDETPAQTSSLISEEESAERQEEQAADAHQEPEVSEHQDVADEAVDPAEDHHADTDSTDAPTDSNADNGGKSDSVTLKLLGDATAMTSHGELTGRHAAALIILELTSEPMPARQISEALWPGDDAEGHTARTRRSRLLSKLRSHLGNIITTTDEGWTIEPGHISTDYDQVLDVLSNEPIDRTEAITEACQSIARPLDGAEEWADYYRAQVITTLTEALAELKTRAIEAEAFDVAKAAKTASTTLGEG